MYPFPPKIKAPHGFYKNETVSQLPSLQLNFSVWTENRVSELLTSSLLLRGSAFPDSASWIHYHVIYCRLPPACLRSVNLSSPVRAETKPRLVCSSSPSVTFTFLPPPPTHSSSPLSLPWSSLAPLSATKPKAQAYGYYLWHFRRKRRKELQMFLLSFLCPPREATAATFEIVNKRELLSVERLSGWSQKRAPWHSLQIPAQGKV